MYKDDDVLNFNNGNTINNDFNEGKDSDSGVLGVLNNNIQTLPDNSQKTEERKNIFGITLDEDEENSRTEGYVQQESGVIRSDYNNSEVAPIINGAMPKRAAEVEEAEPVIDNTVYAPSSREEADDSSESIYQDILGVTQYADLRKMVGLGDNESFTDYYNRTHYVPKGYELTARLLMREEKNKKLYADYKAGNLGYADFLYKAYGKEILKAEGYDFSNPLYWYNRAKNNQYDNPLNNSEFLANVLSMADQKFQSEKWYEFSSLSNLEDNALVWSSGGVVTPEQVKELFSNQFDVITKYFEDEDEFIRMYKAGFVDMSMFNPFIDVDNDKIYDYYYSTDGKLYAIEGSSGKGNNTCKIYYEDGVDENGYKKIDRVVTEGVFGNGMFSEVAETFVGKFLSVFTGLFDFGAQMVGLVGHWCGNDDIAIDWNAFKNNNIAFGGTNVHELEGFQWDEGDDWARGVSGAAGTILGLIASYYLVGLISKGAGALGKLAEEGGGVGTKIAAKAMQGLAFAARTYTGLRGGSITTVAPKLAEHMIANRAVTAAALAIRDGVSTANKLILQNKVLKEEDRLSEGEIVGRTFINIGLNTAISFFLRQIGDSGVTSFTTKNWQIQHGLIKNMGELSQKVSNGVLTDFANEFGNKQLSTIGATLLGKSINTVADIIENVLTQTNTAFLSSKGSLLDENGNVKSDAVTQYFQTMGSVALNPEFILTNLYIAKQDMGFHLIGVDNDGKTRLLPHTEQNYIKAAIVSGEKITVVYSDAIKALQAKYTDLIERKQIEAADALFKGIIKPAEDIYRGTEGESTVQTAMKALIWLSQQTTDIPVETLFANPKKDLPYSLQKEIQQKGPIRVMVINSIRKGAIEKLVAKTAVTLQYYNQATKQIHDANVNIFKGEYSLTEAFKIAKANFSRISTEVEGDYYTDSKGNRIRIKKGAKWVVERAAIDSNADFKNAIMKHALGSYNQSNLNRGHIFLSQDQYEAIMTSISKETKESIALNNVLIQKTEDLIRHSKEKMSYEEQMDVVFGMGGIRTRIGDSIYDQLKTLDESRKSDYVNLAGEEFKQDLEKAVEFEYVVNDDTGNFPEKWQKIADQLGPNGKAILAGNVMVLKDDAHNAIIAGDTSVAKLAKALDSLQKIKMLDKFDYTDDNGKQKSVYVLPKESVFQSLKTASDVSIALRSIYTLAVSLNKESIQSASNMLLSILLDRNLEVLPDGRSARSFVQNYVGIESKTVDGTLEVKNNSVSISNFLEHETYGAGCKQLLSTYLTSLAARGSEAIDRLQLIKIFDALNLSYDDIDTSGNDTSLGVVKQYLKSYEQTGYVKEFAAKVDNDVKSVSQADLEKFASSAKELIANKEVQRMLIDDKIVGVNFFNKLEEMVNFIQGQLGEVSKNLPFKSLATKTRNLYLVDYLNESNYEKFTSAFVSLTNEIMDFDDAVTTKTIVDSTVDYMRFLSGSKFYDKKNLIIVDLSKLLPEGMHEIIEKLAVESYRESINFGNRKTMSAIENEFRSDRNITALEKLCALQTSNDLGIITFDLDIKSDVDAFKSLMINELKYELAAVNGMIASGRSTIPGISFTNTSSRGFELDLPLDKYAALMKKSKIDSNEASVLVTKGQPLDIKLALKDRFGFIYTDEQIDAMTLEDIENLFDFHILSDKLELKGSKELITSALKLGKAASKLDDTTYRLYPNYFVTTFKDFNDGGKFGNALTLLNIIESVKTFNDPNSERTLFAVNMSEAEKNNYVQKCKSLYKSIEIDQGNGNWKVVIAGINPEQWTLENIINKFATADGKIDMRSIFPLPYDKFEDAKTRLSEITYGYETIKVEGLDSNGANLLEFIRGNNFERFSDLKDFYDFLTKSELDIGNYKDEKSINDNLLSNIKTFLKQENANILKALGHLSKSQIDVLSDINMRNALAEAIEKNMGQYTHLGIDKDGKAIVDKLDYEQIAVDSKLGLTASAIKEIVSLLKTMQPTVDGDNLFLLLNARPYTNVASMLRYDPNTKKAFISVDDVLSLTKEQFEVLKEFGLATPQFINKLKEIGKYDTDFKSYLTGISPTSAERVELEIGKETTNIQSVGTGYIPNDDTTQLANELINRSQRLKLERNDKTYFTKLSAMNLNELSSQYLAKGLNLFTVGTVDNPGSTLVANMENEIAVGQVINSIASLSYVLKDLELDDFKISLDDRVAAEIALRIYFNTTGTDMSSSYNRYVIAYKYENDIWHVENIGDNIPNSKEYVSLGRQLIDKGILNGELKYKEAYLFNSDKNVMSSNAAAYGENIKVMKLTDENLNSLRNTIIRNCISSAVYNGRLKLKTADNDAISDAIAKELGSAMTRSEVKSLYMRTAKDEIVNFVSNQLADVDSAVKQTVLELVNQQADKLLSSTLETVENLQSSADWMTLRQHAIVTIEAQKNILTKTQYDEAMRLANKMIADTFDAYTYFLNADSLPTDVKGKISEMIDASRGELIDMAETFHLPKAIEDLDKSNSAVAAEHIKRFISSLPEDQRPNAISKIVQYYLLKGNRGKNLQYALLGNEQYLSSLLDSYNKNVLKQGTITVDGKTYNAKDIVGAGKKIISFDLENYYNDAEDSKIYDIGFAMFTGDDDLKESEPVKIRLLIKYSDSEVAGYKTLYTEDPDNPEKKGAWENYVKYVNQTGNENIKNDDGEFVYVIKSTDDFKLALKKILNRLVGNDQFVLIGHNTKASDIEKIKTQFGEEALNLLLDKSVLHIDTLLDLGKTGDATSNKFNETSLALENLKQEMGIKDENISHLPTDDAVLAYKYFLWKTNNQVDIDKLKAEIFSDVDHVLEKIGYQDIDKSSLFKGMTTLKMDGKEQTFDDIWNGNPFKDGYSKYGTDMSSKLLNRLLNLRTMVQNSEEANWYRKNALRLENMIISQKSSEFLSWLSKFDEPGVSNIESFNRRLSMFMSSKDGTVNKETYENGIKLLNKVFKSYRETELNDDPSFQIEDFLRLNDNELTRIINKYVNVKEKPNGNVDVKSLSDYCDTYVKSEEFQNSKVASDETEAAAKVYNVFDSIDSKLDTKNLSTTTKKMLFDILSSFKTGDFSEAFTVDKSGKRQYVIKWNGPLYLSNYYLDTLQDAVKQFAYFAPIEKEWLMPSGLIPGKEITLYDGSKVALKSTDIGLTKKQFEDIVGGTIEDYRRSIGASDTDDLYIQLYRNPGVGQNVIHTYRVKILASNYAKAILTPDIFAAYHSGDFDSDKIMILKPDAKTQKYGQTYMVSEDKVWGAADDLISYLYDGNKFNLDNDIQKLENFKKQYGYSIEDLLIIARNGSTNQAELDALKAAMSDEYGYIKKVDTSKYPTLKTTSGDMYYSNYVEDAESDEILRRLALDTKFLINNIALKDSATGYMSKKYKMILDGIQKTSSDASELFTYNQIGFSKITVAKLVTALKSEPDNVVSKVVNSVDREFGSEIRNDVEDFLTENIIINPAKESDVQENAQTIINAYRLAELLYRHSDEFSKLFNHNLDADGKETALIPNLIDEADLSKEKENLGRMIELAQQNSLNILDDVTPDDIAKMSYKDIIDAKYKLANGLDETFRSRRFGATSGDPVLSDRMVQAIRMQMANEDSKVNYIDGNNSKNYFEASILLASGLVKNNAADVFTMISDRHKVCSSSYKERTNLYSLPEADINALRNAQNYGHEKITLSDGTVLNYNERIMSVTDADGNTYSDMFDEGGQLRPNIKWINIEKQDSNLNNKLASMLSGDMKGTVSHRIVRANIDDYDIEQDLERLRSFAKDNEALYKKLENLDDLDISKEDKKKVFNLKNQLREAQKEQAQLTADYAQERQDFDEAQTARGENTWDQLYDEFETASKERRKEIQRLHYSIKSKYAASINVAATKVQELNNELAEILLSYNFKNDDLNVMIQKFHERLKELKSYYEIKNDLHAKKSALKNDINLKEKLILIDRMQELGIDAREYDFDNMNPQDVIRLNQTLKTFDYIAAENLLDLSKQTAKTGYKYIYYDKFMNEISDPTQAAYTKIIGRFFVPEIANMWNSEMEEANLDTISYVNDRTNPDTLIKLHGKWYSKTKNPDGTYNFYYNSESENRVNRILEKIDTPWCSSTNGTRAFRILLGQAMYQNCAAVKNIISEDEFVRNLIEGNSTSGTQGAKIIAKVFDMMTEKEINKLYNSKSPLVQTLIKYIPKFMAKLSATDALELNAKQGLHSKNKAKEIAKNSTTLYYFIKSQGAILDDQSIYKGNMKTPSGYPLIDNSDTYFPLEKFVLDLAKACGAKDGYIESLRRNIIPWTLMGKLNFANGTSGTMANNFYTQSYMDSIPYPRSSAATAGIADSKVGDVSSSMSKITPDQAILSQYAELDRSLPDIMKTNVGNNLSDPKSRNDLIHGDFSTLFLNKSGREKMDSNYYSRRLVDKLAVYGSDNFDNRLDKARALTSKEDKIISSFAPRYFGVDSDLGLTYTSNPAPFKGTYGEYADYASSKLYGWARHDALQPLTDKINNFISSEKDLYSRYINPVTDESETKAYYDDISKLTGEINLEPYKDIDRLKDMSDLEYMNANKTNEDVSKDVKDNNEIQRIIDSIKDSKDIAEFFIDRLASSNISDPGMDRAIVQYKINVQTYRNKLLGKEFILINKFFGNNEGLRKAYSEYSKLKNCLTSLQYINEKLSKENLKEGTIKFYNECKVANLKELGIDSEDQIPTIQANIERYKNIFGKIDQIVDTLCERLYAAQKAYCNETGQTCPSRERFFLPMKKANNGKEGTASFIHSGIAKYTSNPFALKRETSGLNPSGAYQEFDAISNILSVATEIGKLQALLSYREEAKANGAMNNVLSFDATCKVIGQNLSLEEMNNYGDSNEKGTEIKGFWFFRNQAQDLLGIRIYNDDYAETSCAMYANLYNEIYTKLIAPLRDTYGDISFSHLLSVSMNNPNDKTADLALKAYGVMMDAIGKITTIQAERGEKTTFTDMIYESITKYAEEHDYAIVDQFGREYNKDLSQFKALSPFATDDFIFRATHGLLQAEGTYEQNVALDALRGDLYFMNKTIAKQTQDMFYTRDPSTIKKFATTVKNAAITLIMANPAKFVSRLINFSMFDVNSSLMTGNFEMMSKLPQITRDISGYLQSRGEYCPESLREFMDVTGVDPLKNQTFYGEDVNSSKNPFFKFSKEQFTAQHIANRYALWLTIKEVLDKNNGDVSAIYDKLGNSYYLKDDLQRIANNMDDNIKGTDLGNSTNARIAAYIVSNQYGTFNDMPGIAGSMSKHGFIFTTFPAALVRFARNELRSGGFFAKEIFTGSANASSMRYLGKQVGSLVALAAIQFALQALPALLMADDDEEKRKELIDDVIENDASLDMFQSILLGDAVYNTSTTWNPFYGVKKIFADPVIKAWKNNQDEDKETKAWKILGDSIAGYFNENVWNRINPALTLIPNTIIPANSWTNPYGNQGSDFFDNLSRRSLAYALGTSGANAFMNTLNTAPYEKDQNFFQTLAYGYNNALKEELGNSKSYKSSWKNYNNALSIVYDYKKATDSNSYNPSLSNNFDEDYCSGLKAKLKNAMKIKASPTAIYGIIKEAINSRASKSEILSAISSVSLRTKIQKMADKEQFFASLSPKQYNIIKSALAYEDSIFPNLDELYIDTQRQQALDKIARNPKPTFKQTASLKIYNYNYPSVYSSSNYKYKNKNRYYNNLNNWNTNTYSKNRNSYSKNNNPTSTYNNMINAMNNGLTTDVWGNQTRHYTDGTTYTVRKQGMPIIPGGND